MSLHESDHAPLRLLDANSSAAEPLRAALRLYSAWHPSYSKENGLRRLCAEIGHPVPSEETRAAPPTRTEIRPERETRPPRLPALMEADLSA